MTIGRLMWGLVGSLGFCSSWAYAQDPLPSFVEVTGPSGISSSYFPGFFTHNVYCGGGAAGDFDGDGWQDVFLFSGSVSGVPDKLYINNGDGSFTDRAAQWGLTNVHNGKGAAVGDYDGDGDLDLYVTSAGGGSGQPGRHRLYRNNNEQSFTDVANQAGVKFTATSVEDGFGAAFGDYDLDGDLDLFVAGFAPNNEGNKLFQNDGDGTFTDVTVSIGLFDQTPSLTVFAPRFADMDGDRYPELLLGADFGTSRYFRNNQDGTFTDITASSGTGQDENGMGQAVGDWDRDGLLDWYVSSVLADNFSEWTGNKLYKSLGNHQFVDVSQPTMTFDGGWGWGTVGFDANHDGWLDIAETNGDFPGGGEWGNEPSYLWMNVPGQTPFAEMGVASGFEHLDLGRGLINFDMDNDGDQDLLVIARQSAARLYRNEVAGSVSNANWLRLFFDTSNNPTLAPDGYGTRAHVTLGSETQMAYLAGGDNFLSQSELSLHFGLGAAPLVDELRVEWANGLVTTLTDVQVNQTLFIKAPPLAEVFCVAKTTSIGCVPEMTFNGFPSLTDPQPFELSASEVNNNKNGLLFYGQGPASLPFLGGTLCAQPPLRRLALQNSGGNLPPSNDCSGSFVFDLNGLAQSGTDPLLAVGFEGAAQYWFRDPQDSTGFGAGLSDAVLFTLHP